MYEDSHTRMGKVVYATGIDYVSGSLAKPKKNGNGGHSCGTYLIGTHRVAATTNPNCTRIYIKNANAYDRSTLPSADELAARQRFTAVQEAVRLRAKDLTHMTQDQEDFMDQRNLANGKKTMKAYLWSICGAAYDAQH